MAARTHRKRMGKRRRVSRKMVKGGDIKLIGEGGFGCIYHSSIPCVTYKDDGSIKSEYDENPNFVSKLTTDANAKKEMNENGYIRVIDMPDLKTGQGKYSIYPFRMCYLTKSIYSRPEIRKQVLGCEFRKITGIRVNQNIKANDIKAFDIEDILTKNAASNPVEELIRTKNHVILELLDMNPKAIALLTMPHGGEDVFDIIYNRRYNNDITKDIPDKVSINDMFVTFMNVINGISEYHKRNFYHLDLKPENIIYNSYVKEERVTKYMKMIDFGLSTMLNTFDTDTNKYDLHMLHNRPIDLFLIQNPLFKDTRYFNFPGVIAMLKDINGGTVPKKIDGMRGKITSIENLNKYKKVVAYVNSIIEKYYNNIELKAKVTPFHVLYIRNITGEKVPRMTINSLLDTYHYYENKFVGDKSTYSLYSDKKAKKEILEKVDVYGLGYSIAFFIYGMFGYTVSNRINVGSDRLSIIVVKHDRDGNEIELSRKEQGVPGFKYLILPLFKLVVDAMDISVEHRITLEGFRNKYNDIIKSYIEKIYKPSAHGINNTSADPAVKATKSFLKRNKEMYTFFVNKYLSYSENKNNDSISISSEGVSNGFTSLGEEYELNYEQIMPRTKSNNNPKYYTNNNIEVDPNTGKFLTTLPPKVTSYFK